MTFVCQIDFKCLLQTDYPDPEVHTGLLLFTIIRIVWFGPWEKKLMTEKIWDLKKFLKKKIMSWCCASVINVLCTGNSISCSNSSPLNIDLNSYTNVFVFKGRKHHFIRVVEFIIICKTVYILKHTAMYLGITQWHIAYIQPTE